MAVEAPPVGELPVAPVPWLSLLIPAYDFPAGVDRILDSVAAAADERIECLVGDDSTTPEVERRVRAHAAFASGRVAYVRNVPARGAVTNWNEMITRASGEYLLFMHHDECPAGSEW